VFWCERAWLGGHDVADGVVITVGGDVIAAVDRNLAAPPSGATRLDGLTLPGFANAHSHSFHRALRGRTHTHGGTFWSWRERMYELATALDPDSFEALATATFAEMVLAGYTVVGEFHYLHHGSGGSRYADANEIGRRVVTAAQHAGIRLTLLDTCYLSGGFGAEPSPMQRRFTDESAQGWVERVSQLGPTTTSRVGAAVHSVRAVDPDSIRTVAAWAAEHDVPLHAHVSEQPKENADCLVTYGRTPVGVLSDAAALSERFTAVHATHVVAEDIETLGRFRSRCCLCPTTERELADGIGPTAPLRDAGVGLCIGSDSHAVIDPFEETRAVELNERLAALRRANHDTGDLLTAATASGYESLGWSGGGRLAVGAPADFVTVAFDSPRLAGSDRADPLAALLFAAAPPDVRHVVVGGEVAVRDGAHQRIDVTAALDRSIGAAWEAVR
jgi:formiminoglutamate deiminase